MKLRRVSRHRLLSTAPVVVMASGALVGAAHATGVSTLSWDASLQPAAVAVDDQLLAPTVSQIGTFGGVPYVEYNGIFEGQTSTGAFRVPYRITAAADPELGNRTVLVEPSHAFVGLGARDLYLRRDLLFTRGFTHAGIGWSTASFGPGFDKRILEPAARGVFIQGGFEEAGGRTDHEIISDFARALSVDPQAGSMLGRVARRYATGLSDSSFPVMDLVTSGKAEGVFDLALPTTTEWADPQLAIEQGIYTGKLVIVNSETEASGNLVDRGVAPGNYRFYAVAGTPHIPDLLEIPFLTSRSTPASFLPALRTHFLQADRWVRTRTPPPASYHLKTSNGAIARDANGNAIAVNAQGQTVPRLPFVELGEGTFTTGFVGSYSNVKTISELGFTSHATYFKEYKTSLAAYMNAGYILPQDAAAMRARAELCPPLTYTQTYRDHYDNFVGIEACGD
jgi:hypothetical protein